MKSIKFPAVENSRNVECLRLLYDQVETIVRNLKTLRVEINTYGSLLIPLLTEKLPDDLHFVKSVRIRSFSGPYFPAFGLNTEIYSVSLRIQFECGKIRTRKTPNTDTFYAVLRLRIVKKYLTLTCGTF